MKAILIVLAIIFVLAMMANGPLFTFAWLMTQRTFMVCLICFALGFIIGRNK